jgi:hypothetical protein
VVGQGDRAVLHRELLQDDAEGHRGGAGGGSGRPLLRGGAAELLVVEDPPRIQDEAEGRLLEGDPLDLHPPGEQGAQPVPEDERVRGQEVAGEGRGVRDREAGERHPGKEGDIHLLHADVGADRGPRLVEERLLELGRVQLPGEVDAVAGRGQDRDDDEDDASEEDLLHGRDHGESIATRQRRPVRASRTSIWRGPFASLPA